MHVLSVCVQLGKILKVIPPHLRTEAMVIMWGRLVDEEESKEAFSKLKPDQYLDCFKRYELAAPLWS